VSLLTKLALWQGLLLVGGFFSIVFWKLMTGGIALDQLLQGDIRDESKPDGFSTETSAARVQSLTVTLFAALYYLLQVIHNPTQFPKLPSGLVDVLAGSQALYLGGKAQALLMGRLRDILKK